MAFKLLIHPIRFCGFCHHQAIVFSISIFWFLAIFMAKSLSKHSCFHGCCSFCIFSGSCWCLARLLFTFEMLRVSELLNCSRTKELQSVESFKLCCSFVEPTCSFNLLQVITNQDKICNYHLYILCISTIWTWSEMASEVIQCYHWSRLSSGGCYGGEERVGIIQLVWISW